MLKKKSKTKVKVKKAGNAKPARRKLVTRKRASSKKKTASRKVPAENKKKTAKKKTRKTGSQTKSTKKKLMLVKPVTPARRGAARKRGRQQDLELETDVLDRRQLRSRSAGQSGDLQGLSGVESADSESVDELLEEGNAFEAEVVSGVEDAGDSGEREVHTHEIPEDDVPEEYLDKDE
jgi:hypothetical protein